LNAGSSSGVAIVKDDKGDGTKVQRKLEMKTEQSTGENEREQSTGKNERESVGEKKNSGRCGEFVFISFTDFSLGISSLRGFFFPSKTFGFGPRSCMCRMNVVTDQFCYRVRELFSLFPCPYFLLDTLSLSPDRNDRSFASCTGFDDG
jgi:hypothetical protein